MRSRHFLKSIALHGTLFAAIALYLVTNGGHVQGGAGLSGATSTHFEVVVTSEISSAPAEKKLLAVRDGLVVKKERPLTLPEDVKQPHPKEIDENPNATKPAEKSNGDSATAAAGAVGQGGTSTVASENTGNSDYSDRFGLYVQRLQQKIQSHLGPSPPLEFDRRAMLLIFIHKDGSSEIQLEQTSGDRELDRRALKAAELSRPFEPWEKDLRVEVPVRFHAH